MKLLCFMLTFSFFSFAQQNNTIQLIVNEYIKTTIYESSIPKELKINRFKIIDINPLLKAKTNLEKNYYVKLNLFDDKDYLAVIDKISINVNGSITVRAKIPEFPLSLILISTTDDKSLGSIYIPENSEHYLIQSIPNSNKLFLFDINEIENRQCKILENTNVDEPFPHEENIATILNTIVDVMLVYTPAAKQWAINSGGGISNVIAQAIEMGNAALNNSNTLLNVSLVNSSEINYTETGDMLTDLNRLTQSSDGFMDQVHIWRNTFGADLVQLLIVDDDEGGLAWVLESTEGTPSKGFGIARIQQTGNSFTSIHEFGHNMGLHHRKDQAIQPGPGLFSYSAGWRWVGNNNNRYCSILSYDDDWNGNPVTTVAQVSNPNINYQGTPTGHTTDGDNARTLRQIKDVISAYRGDDQCVDPFEPNDNCASATNVFEFPLNDGSSNYTPQANIGWAGDEDWYRVDIAYPGDLTINISNLPYDYDLELYGPGCLFIDGSYNGGTNSEQIIYNYSGSSTSVFAKVYPKNPNNYTTSTCYDIQFIWSPSGGGCVPVNITNQPQDQEASVGQIATFSVSVSGSGPFSYFWYKNDAFLTSTTNTTATTNSYNTPILSMLDNGNTYFCRINNCDNTFQDQSNTVVLTVNPICSTPSSQASYISFSGIEPNQMNVNWTNGNGERRIVVAKSGSSITGLPANGTTYNSNSAFGSGSTIAPGEYVVYGGTSNGPTTITNLNPNTTYYFRVFEYNCTGSDIMYLTSAGSNNPNSQSTAIIPTITVTPNSVEFGDVIVGQSAIESYLVSGSNLISVLNIQVPAEAFQISTNGGSDWTNSLTLSGSNINQIIYIKFNPTVIQQYSGSISHTSSGASSISLSINGSGIFSQFTEQTSIQLTGVVNSTAAWGDYDNDGNLDILLMGALDNNTNVSKIYKNNGNGTFTEQTSISLKNVRSGSVAWGDYNNDENLDILLTGLTVNSEEIALIYKNNGDNTFTEQTSIILIGGYGSSVAWGDYNNDGYQDILITGIWGSKVYKNNGNGTFTEQLASIFLLGVNSGGNSACWGDFNSDGYLDILLTGWVNNNASIAITVVYRNNGDETFTEISSLLTGVGSGSVAWGDYNDNGYLDILLTGAGSNIVSKIYKNNGDETFTEQSTIFLEGVWASSVAWADYNNDGFLDILLAGGTIDFNIISKVYKNNGNETFTEQISISLTGISMGSGTWGDYDNDGDLDLLLIGDSGTEGRIAKIYKNNNTVLNSLPSVPSHLTSVGASTGGAPITWFLQWDKSVDNETPQNGLHYNVAIGSFPGGTDVVSPMSNRTNGKRRIVRLGNSQTNTFIIKDLPNGTYYWSVQAIDGNFAGSPFSEEATFTVNTTDISENEIPMSYNISQNFPNPFNPSTIIKYELPFESHVKIVIYNAIGETLMELNETKHAGYHQINFDGNYLASGIYFYSIIANSADGNENYRQIKKMILIK